MKRFVLLSLLLVAGTLGLASYSPALAQTQPSLSKDPLGINYGAETGLSDQDLRISVATVIRFILGFLGLIFVVLILYAGFMWMTSAGNSDRIDKAKSILWGAIIGVAIILFAYAITQFVIVNLYEVSTSNPYNAP